jgi:hypothetical protein
MTSRTPSKKPKLSPSHTPTSGQEVNEERMGEPLPVESKAQKIQKESKWDSSEALLLFVRGPKAKGQRKNENNKTIKTVKLM